MGELMVKIIKRLVKDYHMISNINKMGKGYKEVYNDEEVKIPYINKPGLALTFDDGFRIDHWYKYGLGKENDRNLFGYYDVKATFNINAFHEYENRLFNQEEIDHMLELQHNGHEIANHGYKHKNAIEYTKKYGQARWIEDEVLALNHWMNKQEHSITKEKFKQPVSFIYPYSLYSDNLTNAIVPNYFKICRGDKFQPDLLELSSFECEGVVPALCIDYINLPHIMFIKSALKLAKKTGRNLIIMCHSILPKEKVWSEYNWGEESTQAGKYRISPKNLSYVIKQAKKMDLEFYRLSEIAGVATFIDSNFESEVRRILNLNPKDKWVPINKLINIKELDLAGKNISNIGGIQYFLKLQELNLANNNVSDIRLLSKLKALKKVNLINNNLDAITINNIDKDVEIMI